MYQHEFPDQEDISGFTRTAPPPAFVPKFCKLDKKVLRFFGHFSENIPDGMGTETKRVRNVHLLYFLEDDTLSLLEPRLHNSGLDQGVLIKRHRIPKNDIFKVCQMEFWFPTLQDYFRVQTGTTGTGLISTLGQSSIFMVEGLLWVTATTSPVHILQVRVLNLRL